MRAPAAVLLVDLVALAACGDDPPAPIDPTANLAREIVDTQLAFDVTALSGHATILLGASAEPGASLEVGDLVVDAVTSGGEDLPFAVTGKQLDLGLVASAQPRSVEITFHYKTHDMFDGVSANGFTFLWPYYCGNLFPCHSAPSDGAAFTLDITGVPAGKQAIFAPAIVADAPSYQVAWSVGEYTEIPLGATTAGTMVSVWHLPGEATRAMTGTQNLVAAFDWLEQTLGPYRFGTHVGTVSVPWGPGAYGGMEHHPRWHVGSGSLGSQETNVHEAAHGWFGDGIRIQCWEDFVLSEGTVTYLAARALEVVAPAAGAQAWQSYTTDLGALNRFDPVWPQSCGAIDILEDNLFTNSPYIRGAFFYKALADKVGAPLVDQAIATFYQAHAGGSATMAEMLQTIQSVTGYDPTACADTWLKSTIAPTPGPCP
jgi:aminopeptidase N